MTLTRALAAPRPSYVWPVLVAVAVWLGWSACVFCAGALYELHSGPIDLGVSVAPVEVAGDHSVRVVCSPSVEHSTGIYGTEFKETLVRCYAYHMPGSHDHTYTEITGSRTTNYSAYFVSGNVQLGDSLTDAHTVPIEDAP